VSHRPAQLLAPLGVVGMGAAAAIGGTPPVGAAAWLGIGAMLALGLRQPPTPLVSRTEELERHIMRCRRRAEPAWVLVARIIAPARTAPHELPGCFRVTDSVNVVRFAHGYELSGVFDADGLDREALERRLRAAAGTMSAELAWTQFPDDGVTLQVLLDSARAALPGSAGGDPSLIVPPVLDSAHAPVEGQ
jgi:hypothetical protein